MYKVLRRFEDLQDDRHLYQPGDNFPRAGLKVSEERVRELSSCENKRHVPLIKVISQEQEKSIESEVEKSIEEPKSVEPEHGENVTETSLEEPKETGIGKSKPRKNRTKKEQ